MKLIEEANKMIPPLAGQYREQLGEIEKDIQKRLLERGGEGGAPVTSPQPAAAPGG